MTARRDEPENALTRREAREFARLKPNAARAIRLRCVQLGLLRRDLAPFIGARGRIAEVLNGKRRVTLAMIRALHTGLGIPLEHLCEIPRRAGKRE